MAAARALSEAETKTDKVETTFKSVDAVISAQWDFPGKGLSPLVVLIPPSGKIDRNGWHPALGTAPRDGIYAQFARELLKAGFAVFRFDTPGAGRSSTGHYVTDRSTAIEAYRRATDHSRIDPQRVFLLGHGGGTKAIADIYSRYQAIQPPAGVVLLSNEVGEQGITSIASPTLIVVGDATADDRYQLGEFPADARRNAAGGRLKTRLLVIKGGGHTLLSSQAIASGGLRHSIHPEATKAILGWLQQHNGPNPGQP
jgi:alpha-beta hydrolase superfamily lysophospholipase